MEDALLLRRCKQGDRDALRLIYEKYRDDLLILAIALSHNADVAEDALHDAFVGFVRGLARLGHVRNLKAYLCRCVINSVRDLMGSKHRKNPGLEEVGIDCAVSESDDAANRIVSNEELEQLSAALAKLPFEQREVISLRMHGQMRFGKIAESLGVSVNTAKSRYRYGIDKLRSMLDSEV